MTLVRKQSREVLEHVLANVPELKSEYPIWKTLIKNDCGYIEDLVNTNYMDIPNLYYKTSPKPSESLSICHQKFSRVFISYFHYQTHKNDLIGDDWVKVTNDNFNELQITGYDYLRKLWMAGLLNPVSSETTVSSNPY